MYIKKNKEWLVSDDWRSVTGNIDQVRENLTRLKHNLTPEHYLEGELVHFLDLLWAQCEYDQTFTRMERRIDEMSEQVIDDYADRELIKDIDVDDIRHLKKLQGNFSTFTYQGGKKINCPMCEHRFSKGSRWRAGCKISIFCLNKRSGSRRAENEEQCYTRYNKADFLDHLANRENCIYHKLVLEFKALESCGNT